MRLPPAILLAWLGSCAAFGQTYTISTFAGSAPAVNVLGRSSILSANLYGVAADGAGNLFFSHEDSVLRLDAATGVLTLFAGNGISGFSGDNGPATSAQLSSPQGIGVDSAGNVYIADAGNNRLRKVSNGVITTVAGNGNNGSEADNIPAANAYLGSPHGVAVDAAGNVYIAETDKHRVKKISKGVITTVAGNGAPGFCDGPATGRPCLVYPKGVAVDSAGNVYIAEPGFIRKVSKGVITTLAGDVTLGFGFSGDNGPATRAQLFYPEGLAVDSTGTVYIADTYNNRIRKVSNGAITTVVGNGAGVFGGDGGSATSAQLASPKGVALDTAGNLYIADAGNGRIRKVSSGVITTVAGNGTFGFSGDNGPATNALLSYPTGVAADSFGNVYIADTFNWRIRKVSNGVITTFAGNGLNASVDIGTLYTGSLLRNLVFKGDNGPAASAYLDPNDVAVDSAGNVYIADNNNQRVREVSSGKITTVAGDGNNGSVGDGPATTIYLGYPNGVAVDSAGNLYISLPNYSYGSTIRKVSGGAITTVAGNSKQYDGFNGENVPAKSALLNFPEGMAVDSAGSLYIADVANNRIRKISNGVITTVAGNGTGGFSGDNGPATAAQLNFPEGVAVDSAGNLYIADGGNQRIRKVSNGVITTIAGNGTFGFSGDNGPATSAQFARPIRLAVDSSGKVYVADHANNRIRLLTPAACTYSLDQNSLQFPAAGASLSVTIQTSASCSWAVSGLPGWVTVSGASAHTGPATVTLVAAPNSGVALSATILIAGVSVPIGELAASACTTTVGPGGQAFPFFGGAGGISVKTGAGCSWSAASTTSWITITGGSTGTGNGIVTFQAAANTGVARSGTISVAGLSFVVEEANVQISGLTSHGSMAHLAVAGGWTTTFTIINTDAVAVQARLGFGNDGGVPLYVPLVFPQSVAAAGPLLAVVLDRVLNPNAQIVMDATASDSVATVVGSGELLGNGKVSGFGIFSNPGLQWNAVVPLETRKASRYILAFDNTGTLTTGVAVASLAAQAQNVAVIIRDDTGAQIGTATIALAPRGHTSFMLNDPALGFPATNNKRGTIEFDTPSGGQLSVLGLRANGAALTTLPVLAAGDASGGSIAHLAYHGGWTSSFYLVNTGTAAAQFTLSFFGENGNPLAVPLLLPQSGTSTTTSALTQSLAAGAMLVVDTRAQDGQDVVAGSAQLTTAGSVSGFEIFRWTTFGQEASVPLETRAPHSFVLVFDDTNGLTTGVALANQGDAAANVTVLLYDDAGTLVQTTSINLETRRHRSFLLPDNYAVTANKRGMVEFVVPAGARISAIGLRAKSDGTLTTIPVLTK